MGDRNINCQRKCEAEQERENEAVQEKGLHAYVWESKPNCLFTPLPVGKWETQPVPVHPPPRPFRATCTAFSQPALHNS